MKKWLRNEIEEHIKTNLSEGTYSSAIFIAALFKRLYGDYPKIGLSVYQANAVDVIIGHLPDTLESEK